MNKISKMEIIGKAQCSTCHFREACKHSMNNGGEDYCSVLIDYISHEEKEKNKSYTLKDLGFGDDDSIAEYVEVNGHKGYLGAIVGIGGLWTILIAVPSKNKIDYITIKADDLSVIKRL